MLFETEHPQEMPGYLPDCSYESGLRPGVDLYDKDAIAQLLGEASR
jgi:hypothetical protein